MLGPAVIDPQNYGYNVGKSPCSEKVSDSNATFLNWDPGPLVAIAVTSEAPTTIIHVKTVIFAVMTMTSLSASAALLARIGGRNVANPDVKFSAR